MEEYIQPMPSKNQHNILDVFPKTLIKHRTHSFLSLILKNVPCWHVSFMTFLYAKF